MQPILALIAASLAQASPTGSAQSVQTPAPAVPSVPAAALTPEQQDARCLFAYAYLGGRPGQTVEAARIGVFFFYGKLLSRNPALDLTGVLRAAASAVGEDVSPELIRCGAEVTAAAGAMTRANGALRGAPTP